jgi:hypothetical protein
VKIRPFDFLNARILDEASDTFLVEFRSGGCFAVARVGKKTFAQTRNDIAHGVFADVDIDAIYVTNHSMRRGRVRMPATAKARSHGRDVDWLESLGWLLPRMFREPWLGDLREDRRKWRKEGASRANIEARTISQLACLIIAALWEDVKETIVRSLRMS